MIAAGVQIEIKEVDTKIAGIQTDAWLPDQSIVDPVEVENQWAAHVEDLHQKYGEHTSKLEHNLQLARSEVVQLSSALELMRNTSSSVVGNGGAQQQISLPRQQNLVGDNDEDEEEQNTNLSPISHHHHQQQQVVGGTKRSVSRHHQNNIVLAADGTSSSTIQQQCQNCYRLEEELTSVEEERDSLVRVLAQRHEDYTKGISRLCDQVLDDIDAVHAHMRDQEIVKKKKTTSNTRRNHHQHGAEYSDSDDQQEPDVYHDDKDQQQQPPLSREHQILLHQMQEVGKIAPPFISLQLFDESANSNLHSSSRGIGKVGVRAAFDSRLCVVDSVNPGRETCTWTAKDTKTGKNLCSLKLKVENGASLFVQ